MKFFVPGRPAPQGSKRHVGRGILIESSRRLRPWREDVKRAAIEAWTSEPTKEPVRLTLHFDFSRPKAHYYSGRNAGVLRPEAPSLYSSNGRDDVDKLARGVLDALTGVVYADDGQVVILHAKKAYSERPGVTVEVEKA